MPSTRPWSRTAAAAIAAAVLLTTGCQDSSGGTTGPGADEADWTTSADPVEAGGLIWASGSVVHLTDGTTIDVGEAMTTYVVAGDGVYFTPADSADDGIKHNNMTTGDLMFADRDGVVSGTGLTVYVESIGSSPDGRYLGMIDATSGEKDNFSDYPVATALIVDLSTGKRVVDTTDGMGDPEEQDLAHDYPEIYLRVRFVDTASAVVEGWGDDYLYSLPDGESEVDETDVPLPSQGDLTSPDGQWGIDERGTVEVLLSVDGERVRPRTGAPRWNLGWWFDDTTVVGVSFSGPGRGGSVGPQDTATLITCRVPDGACQDVAGTTGQLLRFPSEDSFTRAIDLRRATS